MNRQHTRWFQKGKGRQNRSRTPLALFIVRGTENTKKSLGRSNSSKAEVGRVGTGRREEEKERSQERRNYFCLEPNGTLNMPAAFL